MPAPATPGRPLQWPDSVLSVIARHLDELIKDLLFPAALRSDTAPRSPGSILVWSPNSVASRFCCPSCRNSTGNISMRQRPCAGSRSRELTRRSVKVVDARQRSAQYASEVERRTAQSGKTWAIPGTSGERALCSLIQNSSSEDSNFDIIHDDIAVLTSNRDH